MELNALARYVYKLNVKKGFYSDVAELRGTVTTDRRGIIGIIDQLQFGQRIALIHSELSEAIEAHRIRKYFEAGDDFKEYLMGLEGEEFNSRFREFVKDTIEDEIVDAFIRILDLCGAGDIDLEFHVNAKLKYNKNRPYKHGKEY